jgi:hypothetical protein
MMRRCNRHAKSREVAAIAWLLVASPSFAALCGDASGDGFLSSTDALRALKLVVTGGYDRRADVHPLAGAGAGVHIAGAGAGDDKLSASDALQILRSAVQSGVPACRGADERLVVVSTAPYDFYSSAGVAVVDVATHEFAFNGGELDGDAVVRTPRGIPVFVNRHNFNSLQVVDTADEDLPTVKACSVRDGFNSNPQDVVLASESKGYVTPYAGASLFVISPSVLFEPQNDPACSGIVTGHVDLSSFDADGVPQMDQMVVVGDELFVALQLLDDASGGLPPKENGVVAIVDTTTDLVTGSIPLSFANPFAETKGLPYDEFERRLYAGGPGNVELLEDGGIEAIDLDSRQSAGMLITGADIHLNIFDFVIVGRRRAFAIVANVCPITDKTCKEVNSVVELDLGPSPADRGIRDVLLSSASALITDIEMTERGELWVAYRGVSFADPPGLRVFEVTPGASGGDRNPEVTNETIVLGQAPFTLAFVE